MVSFGIIQVNKQIKNMNLKEKKQKTYTSETENLSEILQPAILLIEYVGTYWSAYFTGMFTKLLSDCTKSDLYFDFVFVSPHFLWFQVFITNMTIFCYAKDNLLMFKVHVDELILFSKNCR